MKLILPTKRSANLFPKKMKKNKNISAFSLIEISIVIMIIGILIAGVTQGSKLVSKFRISTAQSITESSPVSSISGGSENFYFRTK